MAFNIQAPNWFLTPEIVEEYEKGLIEYNHLMSQRKSARSDSDSDNDNDNGNDNDNDKNNNNNGNENNHHHNHHNHTNADGVTNLHGSMQTEAKTQPQDIDYHPDKHTATNSSPANKTMDQAHEHDMTENVRARAQKGATMIVGQILYIKKCMVPNDPEKDSNDASYNNNNKNSNNNDNTKKASKNHSLDAADAQKPATSEPVPDNNNNNNNNHNNYKDKDNNETLITTTNLNNNPYGLPPGTEYYAVSAKLYQPF
jgi:hypothetical protein